MRERLLGLELRRDVQGDLAGDAVVGLGPARQQQRREHVVGALRAADDVVADGVRPVAVPRLQDGVEHPERALAERIQLHLDAGVALEACARGRGARRRARHPLRIVESLADDLVEHLGVLAHIERGQVKAEGVDAAHQALDVEPAGVAACWLEAGGDELEIVAELPRTLVAIRAALVGERSRSPICPRNTR